MTDVNHTMEVNQQKRWKERQKREKTGPLGAGKKINKKVSELQQPSKAGGVGVGGHDHAFAWDKVCLFLAADVFLIYLRMYKKWFIYLLLAPCSTRELIRCRVHGAGVRQIERGRWGGTSQIGNVSFQHV